MDAFAKVSTKQIEITARTKRGATHWPKSIFANSFWPHQFFNIFDSFFYKCRPFNAQINWFKWPVYPKCHASNQTHSQWTDKFPRHTLAPNILSPKLKQVYTKLLLCILKKRVSLSSGRKWSPTKQKKVRKLRLADDKYNMVYNVHCAHTQ